MAPTSISIRERARTMDRHCKPSLYSLAPQKVIRKTMKIILPDKSVREEGSGPLSVEALLRKLGINPVEVLVSRNGTLVVEDAIVENEDEVRIFRITHGG